MSRWLVTGAGGMLAHDVVDGVTKLGADVAGLTKSDLDVTDPAAVDDALRAFLPDILVNCAGWTRVDEAEDSEAEALRVNGYAPGHLARGCAAIGARLIHISTDYVFPGDATTPYREDSTPRPLTAYGRTKLVGEREIFAELPHDGIVVRTAWLYGAHGNSFVRTMIRLAAERDKISVVDDQRGQLTWTADVAERLIALGKSATASGIYHATSSGDATWYDVAREVFRLLGADVERVRPTSSAAFPRPAPRPAYSVLGHARWGAVGIEPIQDWRKALATAFPCLV